MELKRTEAGAGKMKAERAERLAAVTWAIHEGRAYVETSLGVRKVVGYSDDSGWATTNNNGTESDRRSFMVCLQHIKIADSGEELETVL